MRHTSRRAGLSLVEVLVALVLASLLMVLVWWVVSFDQRRFYVDQNRLSGLSGALLLDEYLSADLERMITFMPDPARPRADYHMDNPVKRDPGGRGITFMMVKEGDETRQPGLIPTTLVTYHLDQETCQVIRRVGNDSAPIRGLLAEELRFDLVPLSHPPRPLGLDSPSFTFNQQAPTTFLRYRLTCISERVREGPASRHGKEERVTLVASKPLLQRATVAQHPYWMMAGTELPSPLSGTEIR